MSFVSWWMVMWWFDSWVPIQESYKYIWYKCMRWGINTLFKRCLEFVITWIPYVFIPMSPYVNKHLDLLGLSLIFINFCIYLDLRLEDQLAIPISVVVSSKLMNISFYLDYDEPSICNMSEHVRQYWSSWEIYCTIMF